MVFERIPVNSSIEKRILTGSIVSTEFLEKIHPIFNKEYLESTFIRKVMVWAGNFFVEYGKAPGNHIKDIFYAEKKGLKDDESEIIESLLNDILSGYVEGSFNDDYIIDQAITFFKERELTITANNITYYVQKGNVEEAEKEIESYVKIIKPSFETNGFIDDEEAIAKTFEFMEDDGLFKLPRSLGKFMGPMQRGWLVGLSAPFKKGKCLSSLDKVLMWDGSYVPVKEIFDKELTDIVTYNESAGKFQKGKILDWYDNGEKELFRVQTKTGREVNITANHPLLTENGWNELSTLEVGDHIAVPRKFECGNFRIEDEHKIKFLAYMIADGGLTSSQLAFTKQEQIIREDFINSVEKFGDSVKQKTDKNEMYITPCNGNCRQWLTSLGIGNEKSIHKVIPNWVFTLNQLVITLFLQTLFTCDGSICKTRTGFYIDYSSGSKELLYQVHHLLLRFGIVSKIRYRESECNNQFFDSWILTIRAKKDVIKFCRQIHFRPGRKQDFVNEFYVKMNELPDNRGLLDLFYNLEEIEKEFNKTEGSNWSLLRDTINQAKKKNGGISRNKIKQMYEYTNNPYFKYICESEILWDKIVSITPIGKHQTYDLTVKDHHNFIANDILVHNTWMLGEFLKSACMSGLRVASFNLEMNINHMRKRTYMSLTGASDVHGPTMFPCFDCKKNQDDSCEMPERTNHVKIPVVFDRRSKYKACTYCKDNGMPENFDMGVWNEIIDVPRLDFFSVKKHMHSLKKLGRANVWLECMPRFSASVSDIERKLDNLESMHNFIPDVLLIDYADILRSDDPHLKGVEKEDDVWMALARIASVRNCCTIVPTQLNKDSLDAKQIKTSHTSKWIGKLGHVDAMYALNQQPAEKLLDTMRVSCLEHRHKDFNETDNCYVLQKYSSGQAHLDSYWNDNSKLRGL